jgi:hypothetical protein
MHYTTTNTSAPGRGPPSWSVSFCALVDARRADLTAAWYGTQFMERVRLVQFADRIEDHGLARTPAGVTRRAARFSGSEVWDRS